MTKRQSNLELLRIIACLMVIAVHIIYPVIPNYEQGSTQWISLFITSMVVKSGVIIFVLLFGYFAYNKAPNIKKRVGRVLIPYITYWILFTLYLIINSGYSTSIVIVKQVSTLFNSYSENYFGQVWYIYILTAIIFLSPYINKLIDGINKKQHRNLILTLFVIFSVIPTLNRVFEYNLFYSFFDATLRYNIPIFLLLYLTGAYIKKYDIKLKKIYSLLGYLVGSALLFALIMLIQRNHFPFRMIKFFTKDNLISFETSQAIIQSHVADFELIMYYSSFLLISTVFLFLLFKEIKINYNKIINYIASLTFGIFLNHLFVRNFLYESVYNLKTYKGNLSVLYVLLYVLSIFIFGAIIEAIRMFIGKKIKLIVNKPNNEVNVVAKEQPKAS